MCSAPNCDRKVYARGLCKAHYERRRRGSKIESPVRESGIPVFRSDGYIQVYQRGKYIGKHRLVIEEAIGRSLSEDEFVHHKNGVRHDNRLENLELWSRSHPSGQRLEDKISWAKEFLQRYAPDCFSS